MKTNILQKTQLMLVTCLLNTLWVIDDLANHIRLTLISFGRLVLCLIIIAYLLKAVPLSEQKNDYTNYLYVLNPTIPQVLGAASDKFINPRKISENSFPEITAYSVYARDMINDTVLFEKNSQIKLAPASTTKLMTALIALDIYDLNNSLIVPKICTEVESQKSGFISGESYKILDLLSSLLINSSGDAACTLSLGKLSYTEFVKLMNDKAQSIGLSSTKFTNPIGLDDIEGNHVSTAADLYLLGKEAQKSPIIKDLVSAKEKTITGSLAGDFKILNTNSLLWDIPGTVGIKTGRTEAAGEVLVYEYISPINSNIHLMIVVMGSQDRFGDTINILNWILNSYRWYN